MDLVLTPDQTRAITANQTSHTISLVDLTSGAVLDEVDCGERPSNVVISSDGARVLATASYSGQLLLFELSDDRLKRVGELLLSYEPRGIALSPDDRLAYVALSSAGVVAVVDVERLEVVERIEVGRWPRFLALSPDGGRLAVGCNGDGGIAVVDTATRTKLFLEDFSGLNFGQMQVAADSLHVYFPWIVYRHNPVTSDNIRRGWVLASRIARVRLDEHQRREAISLDPRGQAVADPHGLALSPDEQVLVCAASGTHELLVYQLPGLPLVDYGGPGDHIDADLLADPERFQRIPLGGRPMAVRYAQDGQRVYVANYLLNAIQEIDMTSRQLARTIPLGPDHAPSLARQGEAIFHDGARSLDQWYSCHSCHYEGHTNAVAMDTRNDGRFGNFKTVLSLRGVTETGPWFWHGWADDLHAAVRKSLSDTMLGPTPTDADVEAVAAYLATLTPPPNPHRQLGTAGPSAARGEATFHSDKAGCASCHPAPWYTDGQNHDVGLGSRNDAYPTFNPPSLRGIRDRAKYLHGGNASNLKEVLSGPHDPQRVTGLGSLTDEELDDLIAYLETL